MLLLVDCFETQTAVPRVPELPCFEVTKFYFGSSCQRYAMPMWEAYACVGNKVSEMAGESFYRLMNTLRGRSCDDFCCEQSI